MKPMSAMKAIREDTVSDKAAAEANQMAIGQTHVSHKCPHCGKFSATQQGIRGHHAADATLAGTHSGGAEMDHSKDHGSRNSTAAEPKTKGSLGHRNEQPYARARKAVKTHLASLSKRDGHQYK